MSAQGDAPQPQLGQVSWNELLTPGTGPAGEFYAALFGWKPEPFDPGGMPAGAPPYTVFRLPSAPMGVAGMMAAPDPASPALWIPYVVVENADTALALAVKLGATVCVPVMAVGMVGRIAVVRDPQGAFVGLHELTR